MEKVCTVTQIRLGEGGGGDTIGGRRTENRIIYTHTVFILSCLVAEIISCQAKDSLG